MNNSPPPCYGFLSRHRGLHFPAAAYGLEMADSSQGQRKNNAACCADDGAHCKNMIRFCLLLQIPSVPG